MQAKQKTKLHIHRSAIDRRVSASGSPPYHTEEGIVLVDRRENKERRKPETKLHVFQNAKLDESS